MTDPILDKGPQAEAPTDSRSSSANGAGQNQTRPDGPASPKPEANVKSPGPIAPGIRKPVETVLHDCRRTFYFAIGLTVISDTLSMTPMFYMMNVTDKVVAPRSGITLISLTALVLVMYLFWSAMDWIRSRILVRLSLRIDWDLSADIFDASFRRYVTRKNINVHQLLGDLTTLRDFVTGQGLLTLIDAPFTIVFTIIGAFFHPYLAIFSAVACVLMAIAAYFTQKVTSPALKVANDSNAEAGRVASNSLRHAESTLALGMMGAVRQRWYTHHHKHLQHQVNASEASGLMGGLSGILSKAMPSLQMALGAFLAMENLITAGMMMAASMLISKAVSPIQKVLGNWKLMVSAHQSYERINALLALDDRREARMQLPPVSGHLVVNKVSAVPPGHNKAVLTDLHFEVKPGQVIAVVGPSAAGKTCLARMLIGVWKPSTGSVRLDGVEISDWSHDEFGPQLGYVPQEIEFFEGTVAENIARLGEIDPEKVVQATKLIGMHETILAFPKGYDTLLGETGFALSGGQRQRLAICRALYGMPKYIVMDEPNANLDEVGESALAQALGYLKTQGSSVIITTHRPRLVGVADNLLVLRNGAQVGFGPADEMINAVRNLQVVAQNKASDKEAADEAEDVVLKEGTNDAPVGGSHEVTSKEGSQNNNPQASVASSSAPNTIDPVNPSNTESQKGEKPDENSDMNTLGKSL